MTVFEDEAKIIPSQIRKAREELALSVDEIASLVDVTADTVSKWEEGTEEPSVEQLWELARILHRGTDYFLRSISKIPAKLSYRTTKWHRLEQLPLQTREAIVQFDELCRAETELERLLGKPHKVLVPKSLPRLSPEATARNERLRLALGTKPIENLKDFLISLGIRIFMLPNIKPKIEGVIFAGNIMATVKPPQIHKVGRNAPCPCGSGKKYKRCHGE